ncbi:MAG TPA: GMP synthase subunit A [Candidatus Bathyarchaeia archaeon]|nr:GMP synthase subunit A [Candidatus Bathyarchaeia archaeon]
MTSVLVVNNYGQFAHLIHRAVRDLGTECELVKNSLAIDEVLERSPDGLILSGGPTMDRIGNCKQYVHEIKLPILGICLGHQLIAEEFGGAVRKGASGGYARVAVEIVDPDDILQGMGSTINTWASHADEVSRMPSSFVLLARSAICEIEAMKHPSKPIYGVQWHPEVAHTEGGNTLLQNFLTICDER